MDQDTFRNYQRGHSRTKSNTESINNNLPRPRHVRTKSTKKVDSIFTDDATTAFIRRTLCAQNLRSGAAPEGAARGRATPQPLTELLPPLTNSNQVDLQLYALISIIIKDFVQAWYSKITPDHEFTDQVVQIIAHCTRALEQRIKTVDLEALILDELPELLDVHVTAYRTAYNGSYTSSLVSNPREIYHAIHNHPALSPVPLEAGSSDSLDQADNEAVWRQLLVQGALLHLLPPEDLENPCLKVLVTEIFSELILGKGVCGNVCESWFVWEIILKLLAIIRPPEPELLPSTPNRLEKFGLLAEESTEKPNSDRGPLDALFQTFSHIIHYFILAFLAMRSFIAALSDTTSLPSRTSYTKDPTHDELDSLPRNHPTRHYTKRPILAMSIWSCCSHLLSLDLRMPWLTAMGAFIQWLFICGPWKVGYTDGRLDRSVFLCFDGDPTNQNRHEWTELQPPAAGDSSPACLFSHLIPAYANYRFAAGRPSVSRFLLLQNVAFAAERPDSMARIVYYGRIRYLPHATSHAEAPVRQSNTNPACLLQSGREFECWWFLLAAHSPCKVAL